MNLLHTIGLMTRAEHKRLTDELDNDAFASWNKAITDRDDMRMQRDDWQAKHASVCTKLNEMTAKYKQAVADLEKQAGEIAALKRDYARRGELLLDARAEREIAEAEVKALRPDAEAMRKKRTADRKRMAGKRGKGQ